MKIIERIQYLQVNHFSEWLNMRKIVEEELSSSQSMFCVCGRLATGLHEMNCRKFHNKVNSETVKRLSSFLKIRK